MRNVGTAYLLLAMQFFGVAGLHRFYLGKPITGLLWFFTFGLGGLGTLYDLLTMEEQVDLANRRGLPAARDLAWHGTPRVSDLGILPSSSGRSVRLSISANLRRRPQVLARLRLQYPNSID